MSEALETAAAALREKFTGADFENSVKFEVEDEGVIRYADGEVTLMGQTYDGVLVVGVDTVKVVPKK